jgi:hypothetical protein
MVVLVEMVGKLVEEIEIIEEMMNLLKKRRKLVIK